MIIDNFYAALYSQAPVIGAINPPGELNYKGYSRKLFCSISGNSIEDITFGKAEENSADPATHLVVMTHNGTVRYSMLLSHNKGYKQ